MWGIGTASEEGTIVVEGKARGTKKTVRELIDRMKERGFAGGRVAISHCDNLAVAQTLKENILRLWGNSEIEIIPTRGLCSYYAERGGLQCCSLTWGFKQGFGKIVRLCARKTPSVQASWFHDWWMLE
ncbi:MAG: hypothetical protein BHV62_02485 [Eggerthella sp. 51_9]|nr:MAG: hypothetical protein BHV62_02485 [Eggerthella sp. 51_9]